MDEDSIENEFEKIAIGTYRDSVDQFVEYIRLTEHATREAMAEDDFEKSSRLAGELFMACSSVQIGNVANVFTSFGNAINAERDAGIQLYSIARAHLVLLKSFHAHLVAIGQPNDELAMVTDMMAVFSSALDESTYGVMDAATN